MEIRLRNELKGRAKLGLSRTVEFCLLHEPLCRNAATFDDFPGLNELPG